MSESENRKPIPSTRESAQIVLNKFLKENGILIGTNRPRIDFTDSGAMIISPSTIIAIYEEDAKPKGKAN